MGTVADKLAYLLQTKEQIRSAIENKGVAVEADTAFRAYPGLIEQIETGTAEVNLPDKIIYYNNINGYEYVADGYTVKSVASNLSTAETAWATLDTSGSWSGLPAIVSRTATHGYEISLQRTRSGDTATYNDNGFSSGCPGLTIGGWFYRNSELQGYKSQAFYLSGPIYASGWGISGLYTNASYPNKLTTIHNGSAYSNIYTIIYNTWYHFALTLAYESDGQLSQTLYVNSMPVHTVSSDCTIDFTRVSISSADTNCWCGYIKNPFVSWGVLTQEEIRQMMMRD